MKRMAVLLLLFLEQWTQIEGIEVAFPGVIQVLIQERGWKQAEFEGQ